ncbi:hypothetical protein AR543_p0166 (plasmid) [Paenibacillus bovis]|uniref:Uncharacterized protein n=1 Tax=Paenibacillus bovis TaxID=1616788 RepID=A0A1X9T4G3_9BACL|nr:hypothetical protein AR543_p0166 [Paenibacillus bovis]
MIRSGRSGRRSCPGCQGEEEAEKPGVKTEPKGGGQ